MKKLYVITALLCASILLPTPSAQADVWFKVRGSCSWFYKQYKTRAWINQVQIGGGVLAGYCNETKTDCDLAKCDCYWSDKTVDRAIAIAGDRFKVPSDDPVFTVWLENTGYAKYVLKDGGYNGEPNSSAGFNRMLLLSDQTNYFIAQPKVAIANSTREGSIYHQGGAPIFDYENHTITILDVRGELQVGVSDLTNDFSALTISVTHEPHAYVESEDPYTAEDEYLNNLVWSSTAMLNNGRVLMDGVLTPANFTVTKNDGQKSTVAVAMHIDKLIIPVPENIDLDEVSINFGVDGGNLGLGISQKFNVTNPEHELTINPLFFPEEVFEFVNYPNPVSDVLNIQIELPYTYLVKVRLLDINGKKVKDMYEGYLPANQLLEIQGSLKGLPAHRVYFLELETRDRVLTRKVIIE